MPLGLGMYNCTRTAFFKMAVFVSEEGLKKHVSPLRVAIYLLSLLKDTKPTPILGLAFSGSGLMDGT